MIKTAILSVAFYSEKFSKVFVGSLRKYYPVIDLVIVDNNLDATIDKEITEMGKRESAFLQDCGAIYIKNTDKNKSHGIALDTGMVYLLENGYQLVITIDIDSVITMRGFVELCESNYAAGYMFGGRMHRIEREGRKSYFVHPCFAFYDLQLLASMNISFEDERRKDTLSTGERISYTLEGRGFEPVTFGSSPAGVVHFGSGSVLRMGENFVKHKLLGNEKYEKKLKAFFEREDVKCHL